MITVYDTIVTICKEIISGIKKAEQSFVINIGVASVCLMFFAGTAGLFTQ